MEAINQYNIKQCQILIDVFTSSRAYGAGQVLEIIDKHRHSLDEPQAKKQKEPPPRDFLIELKEELQALRAEGDRNTITLRHKFNELFPLKRLDARATNIEIRNQDYELRKFGRTLQQLATIVSYYRGKLVYEVWKQSLEARETHEEFKAKVQEIFKMSSIRALAMSGFYQFCTRYPILLNTKITLDKFSHCAKKLKAVCKEPEWYELLIQIPFMITITFEGVFLHDPPAAEPTFGEDFEMPKVTRLLHPSDGIGAISLLEFREENDPDDSEAESTKEKPAESPKETSAKPKKIAVVLKEKAVVPKKPTKSTKEKPIKSTKEKPTKSTKEISVDVEGKMDDGSEFYSVNDVLENYENEFQMQVDDPPTNL
jgi:hypothetical protein